MSFKSSLFLFVSLFIFCNGNHVSAQCIDSNLVNPDYICNEPYNAQCGCDGEVYRSECAAHYQGGNLIYTSFFDGNCGDYDFEIRPTLVDQGFIRFEIFLKKEASVYINIFDVFGRKKYEENLGFVDPPFLKGHDIYLNGYEIGMYIFIVQVNGEEQTKKFVKGNEY